MIYLHGQPGSAAELKLHDGFYQRFGRSTLVPDRAVNPEIPFPLHMDVMTADVLRRLNGRTAHLFGFSIGAYVAIELAARLGSAVAKLDLVSAAAPLQAGDFTAHMAGGKIFQLAQDHPHNFRRLTKAQSWLATLAPGLMRRLLLASAEGDDAQLAAQPAFKRLMNGALRQSFGPMRLSYLRDISSYVQDWSGQCVRVEAPVTLWHGRADNWSPPLMVAALEALLPNVKDVKLLPGLSHYSTLKHAFAETVAAKR